MNELDFLEALNDIEDDLILDAKKTVDKRSLIPSHLAKVAVAAAIVCLMSVTVMAVSFSVRILRSEERIPIPEGVFMGQLTPDTRITTVDYDLQQQKIHLPSDWAERLTEQWKAFPYDYSYFKGMDLKHAEGSRINFGGISQLESLLGIELVSSPELDRAVRGSYISLVVTDPRRAAEELRREGRISPDGLVIYLPFYLDGEKGPSPDMVDYCGLNIFLPLTEPFAESYSSHTVLSSVGDQDLQESRQLSQGGIESILLSNSPGTEDPMKAYAAWEHEGIGYLLELKTHHRISTAPASLLDPYLKDLK